MSLTSTLRTHFTFVTSAFRRVLLTGVTLLGASQAWAFQSATVNGGTHASGAGGNGGLQPGGAPEINPALVLGAVVLLIGGVLILTSRRRRPATSSGS